MKPQRIPRRSKRRLAPIMQPLLMLHLHEATAQGMLDKSHPGRGQDMPKYSPYNSLTNNVRRCAAERSTGPGREYY